MPGRDLVNLVQQLHQEWGPHEENTALLLETLTAQLDWGWADRTIDPEDPKVKAEQEKRKKIKPPPHPILRPVACRPVKQDQERWEAYATEIAKYVPPEKPQDPFELLAQWRRQHGFG